MTNLTEVENVENAPISLALDRMMEPPKRQPVKKPTGVTRLPAPAIQAARAEQHKASATLEDLVARERERADSEMRRCQELEVKLKEAEATATSERFSRVQAEERAYEAEAAVSEPQDTDTTTAVLYTLVGGVVTLVVVGSAAAARQFFFGPK